MSLTEQTARLTQFRQSLYGVFNNYADVLMNLIDALSSNTTARSVVELSLNPAFERGYSALFKGIANYSKTTNNSRIGQTPPAQEPSNQPKEASESKEVASADLPAAPSSPAPDLALDSKEAASADLSATPSSPAPDLALDSKQAASADLSATPSSPAPDLALDSKQVASADLLAARSSPGPDLALDCKQAASADLSAAPSSPAPDLALDCKPVPSAPVGVLDTQENSASSSESKALIAQAAQKARRDLENKIQSLVVPYLPSPQKRPFHLFALDVTSQARQFSPTLEDRGFVYQPNAIKGNKPVTIGHQYSVVAYLPEKEGPSCPPWVVPLSTRRVATLQDKELVGFEQLQGLISNESFDFHHQLSVQVGDTAYSKREFLYESAQNDNLVTVARVRSDRTFYRQYQAPENEKTKAGHPTTQKSTFFVKRARQLAQARSTGGNIFCQPSRQTIHYQNFSLGKYANEG